VSLLIDPFFPHARVLGLVLLPLVAWAMAAGLARLASCFLGKFDVMTLLAGATMVVLVVIAMCAGVVLASVVAEM
jgi:hypothetical protein